VPGLLGAGCVRGRVALPGQRSAADGVPAAAGGGVKGQHGRKPREAWGLTDWLVQSVGKEKMKGSTRYGLVTFALGITCGTLGHFLQTEYAFLSVLAVSAFYGFFGKLAVEDKD